MGTIIYHVDLFFTYYCKTHIYIYIMIYIYIFSWIISDILDFSTAKWLLEIQNSNKYCQFSLKNIAVSIGRFSVHIFGSYFCLQFRRVLCFFAVSKNRRTHAKTGTYKNCSEAEKMPPAIIPERAICVHTLKFFQVYLYTNIYRYIII